MYPRGLRLDDTLSTATDKSGKKEKNNTEIQDSPDPLELMINKTF